MGLIMTKTDIAVMNALERLSQLVSNRSLPKSVLKEILMGTDFEDCVRVTNIAASQHASGVISKKRRNRIERLSSAHVKDLERRISYWIKKKRLRTNDDAGYLCDRLKTLHKKSVYFVSEMS